MRKVLIVTTSHGILGPTGYPTGLWLSELTHPYFELIQAGFEVDIASLQGGKPPVDPWSDPANPQGINQNDLITIGFLHSPHAVKLENTLQLSDVDTVHYEAVLFSGGNGAIFDYPKAPEVASTIEKLWNAGKIVSTVCHGGAALLEARLPDGTPLIHNQDVTAFSNQEEHMAQSQIGQEYLPFYLEDELPKRGARYHHAAPFKSYVVVSGGGRLITGQQNFSGAEIGRKLVEALGEGSVQ